MKSVVWSSPPSTQAKAPRSNVQQMRLRAGHDGQDARLDQVVFVDGRTVRVQIVGGRPWGQRGADQLDTPPREGRGAQLAVGRSMREALLLTASLGCLLLAAG
ncbi:MAG: hypothetical protein H0V00_11910 [Chloroflexia bacterium]|nr:hypothetical protein [Chloroflexia bacterium]